MPLCNLTRLSCKNAWEWLRATADPGVASAIGPAFSSGRGVAGAGRGQGGSGRGATAATGARAGSTDDIVGNPIGRDALMSELAFEMIPYTPEELIAIANKEFAWCEAEMKRASRRKWVMAMTGRRRLKR